MRTSTKFARYSARVSSAYTNYSSSFLSATIIPIPNRTDTDICRIAKSPMVQFLKSRLISHRNIKHVSRYAYIQEYRRDEIFKAALKLDCNRGASTVYGCGTLVHEKQRKLAMGGKARQ